MTAPANLSPEQVTAALRDLTQAEREAFGEYIVALKEERRTDSNVRRLMSETDRAEREHKEAGAKLRAACDKLDAVLEASGGKGKKS